jgi:hypothetical protein
VNPLPRKPCSESVAQIHGQNVEIRNNFGLFGLTVSAFLCSKAALGVTPLFFRLYDLFLGLSFGFAIALPHTFRCLL